MELKKATQEDHSNLIKICVDSYSKTYHDHWEEDGLSWYLEREFGSQRITSDLSINSISYYFIEFQGKPIGFIKTNADSSITGFRNTIELVKFYIVPKFTGKGIGSKIFNLLLNQEEFRNKEHLFLCVIDTNLNAIRLYTQLGFVFHSKTKLDLPYFKEELKGMHRMVKALI